MEPCFASVDNETVTEETSPSIHSPSYLKPTLVAPKGPLQDYSLNSQQQVFAAFTPNNYCGIRALPNALQPNFRERLYSEIVETVKEHEAILRSRPGGPSPNVALATRISPGQKSPSKHHPLGGVFTTYEHMHSEYERERLLTQFQALQSKLNRMSNQDFVVKSTPCAPKCAPAFSEFTYEESPYDSALELKRAEEQMQRSGIKKPFKPGGASGNKVVLKGRAEECIAALYATLSRDWPSSFLHVFTDTNDAIVLAFDGSKVSAEGDLTAYMAQLVKTSLIVQEFHLVKDGAQWGLCDQDSAAVFYSMWPPWASRKGVSPERLSGIVTHKDLPPASPSARSPFIPTTSAGMIINTPTRMFETSMRI